MAEENKRIGGYLRAQIARIELISIFKDTADKKSLLKDIEYAHQYDVTRHTIASIREELSIPARTERILIRLKELPTAEKTLYELCDILGIKYQNLYKIVKDNNLPYKPDVQPIEYLKRHATNKKIKTLELIKNSGITKEIEEQLQDIKIISLPKGRRQGIAHE